MEFKNTKVFNFEGAMRGMRNPKESWHLNDTIGEQIGPNDLKLAKTLIKAGSEHRKFLRQVMVSVDITAPLYWWKEFDTYKVGTVANSTSTMHKLATTPITIDCFDIDDYCGVISINGADEKEYQLHCITSEFINFLERLRLKYLETKNILYWKELIRWLPSGWLQTRTVTMTYENLFAMCSSGQRRFHKLSEWRVSFMDWARALPNAKDFIFIDEE